MENIERVEGEMAVPALILGMGAPFLIRPFEIMGSDPYSMIETHGTGLYWPNGDPILYEVFEVMCRPKCGHITCPGIDPVRYSLN